VFDGLDSSVDDMIDDVVPSQESLTVEFKSDRDCLSDDDVVEAAVCLANTEGGSVYVGVEDDGRVTGLHPSRPVRVEPLSALVANRTSPPLAVTCREIRAQGQRVAVIEVPKSRAIVARSDGLIKRRRLRMDGRPECVPFLPGEHLSRHSDLRLVDPSAQVLAGATVADFDPLQRARLRTVIERNPRSDKALLGLGDEEIEGALGLSVSEGGQRLPTLAGVLMIGKTEALRRLVPTHEVLFQVLDGTNVRVNEPSAAALVEVVEWLDLLCRGVNTEQAFSDGLFRIGIARVDTDALREALNNALVHRDYARLGPIRVCWQDDELIISNPGGFVEGVSLDSLLTTEPKPRNPKLADAFKRIGLVERTGRGVDLIYSGMLRFGRPAPDYTGSRPDLVKLVVSTEAADLAFVRMLIEEEARGHEALPVESLVVLTELRRDRRAKAAQLGRALQRSEAQAARICERLAERGLLQANGAGRHREYILHPTVYRSLGQKAEYVRQAGFDAIQRVEMIRRYVVEHRKIKRDEAARLCQMGSLEAKAVLRRMVDDGVLELHGLKRGAHYTLAAKKPPGA
jgi:ATP-dependent DNA helicase RecG